MRLLGLPGVMIVAIAALAPAASFAQFNQASIISTSMGGIVSGTYGYFKYISASSVAGASADRITSGTTSMVAQSGGLISITTNGTNTGYFNSNGVLTVPGISATANLTNVTTLYASGKVGIGTPSPNAPLDVSGTINASNIIANAGGGTNGNSYFYSGSASKYSRLTLGRIDDEFQLAVAAANGQFFSDAVSGTVLLKNYGAGDMMIGNGNGHPAMTIANANNYVGIGTISPTAPLDVYGSQIQLSAKTASTTTLLRINDGPDVLNGNYLLLGTDTTGGMAGYGQGGQFIATGANGTGTRRDLILLTFNPSETIQFATNHTERMRIGAGGGVGIGTTTIPYILTVSGTGRFYTTDTNSAIYASASGNTYGVYAEASHASGAAVKGVHTTNNSSGVLGLVNIGVYGVGAGATSWGVQGISSVYGGVYGSGAAYGVYGAGTGTASNGVTGLSSSSGGSGVYGSNTSTGSYGGLGYANYGAYGISTNNYGGYFQSTASGYAGLYSYGPTYGVYAETNGSYGVYGRTNASGGYGTFGYNTYTGASGGLGAIGYGVFCGAGTCGGVNAWSVSSDARLKDNIESLPENWGLAAIGKLRPVTYHWRDVKRDSKEGEQIGFIAQEVKPVLPALVSQDKGTSTTITVAGGISRTITDPMSIKYDLLVVPLVKAVQELKADSDKLHADNENLRASNASLQRQVNNLSAAIEPLRRQVQH